MKLLASTATIIFLIIASNDPSRTQADLKDLRESCLLNATFPRDKNPRQRPYEVNKMGGPNLEIFKARVNGSLFLNPT